MCCIAPILIVFVASLLSNNEKLFAKSDEISGKTNEKQTKATAS